MLMKNMTPGKQVWFQESGVNENGKTERRMCQGMIMGLDGKKVSVQMEGEEKTRAFHPFQCFATQDELKSEMKWDLYMDTFQDKLCSAAEKYMGKCTDFLKGYTRSMVPQGQELLATEAGNKLKLAGSRFKESVSSFVDNFTGQAQDHTMSLMDRAAHHVMLHHDLSQFEPGHFQAQTREGFTEGFMDAVKNAQDNDFTRAVENIGKTDGMSL